MTSGTLGFLLRFRVGSGFEKSQNFGFGSVRVLKLRVGYPGFRVPVQPLVLTTVGFSLPLGKNGAIVHQNLEFFHVLLRVVRVAQEKVAHALSLNPKIGSNAKLSAHFAEDEQRSLWRSI